MRYLAEMVARVVTKHAKGLNLWLRLVETRTLRAARANVFGRREFHSTRVGVAEIWPFFWKTC